MSNTEKIRELLEKIDIASADSYCRARIKEILSLLAEGEGKPAKTKSKLMAECPYCKRLLEYPMPHKCGSNYRKNFHKLSWRAIMKRQDEQVPADGEGKVNLWLVEDYLKKALLRWDIDGKAWVEDAIKELTDTPEVPADVCKTCGGSGKVYNAIKAAQQQDPYVPCPACTVQKGEEFVKECRERYRIKDVADGHFVHGCLRGGCAYYDQACEDNLKLCDLIEKQQKDLDAAEKKVANRDKAIRRLVEELAKTNDLLVKTPSNPNLMRSIVNQKLKELLPDFDSIIGEKGGENA